MDLLLLILIVLAVLSIGGWGYGYYSRPVVAGDAIAAPAAYATPLGILGVLVVVALCVMLFTGWRPFPIG